MLKTVEYLQKNSLETLRQEFKIKVSYHIQYPNLVGLKYNQIESPMHEEIVQECRGLILDSSDNWRPIAMGFKKFFNKSEHLAINVDILHPETTIYEKLDGTCCILYWYGDEWHVATLGSPNASGPVGFDGKTTFAQLFWDTFKQNEMRLPDNKDNCYVFELTTPYNKIVVQHKESKLHLIGVRNMVNLKEVDVGFQNIPEIALNWPICPTYSFLGWEDMSEKLKLLKASEHEGFVVCDKDFNRIKVKSDEYVRIHHMFGSVSIRNLLELVRGREESEFLTYFPEYTDVLDKITAKYNALLQETESVYNAYQHIETQKEFALAILKYPFRGAMFEMRAYKIASFEEYYAQVPIKSLECLLDLSDCVVQNGDIEG